MRTNVVIDDRLLDRAMEITGLPTRKATIEEALRFLLRMHAQRELASMGGTIEFEPGYDYKTLRRSKHGQ